MSIAPFIIVVLALLIAGCVVVLWLLLRQNPEPTYVHKTKEEKVTHTSQTTEEVSAKKADDGGLKVLFGAVAALFTLLFARTGFMQLVNDQEYENKAENNRTRTVKIQAPRGRILDRNGVELVTNRGTLAVSATSDLSDDAAEIGLLANLLGMPKEAIIHALDAKSQKESLVTILPDLNQKQVAFISEHPEVFQDVTISEQETRAYTNGTLAAHVLGYTSEATQDQINASKDSDHELSEGDIVGQAGIEAQYENVLKGEDGEMKLYVSADGSVQGSAETLSPISGSDVVLTLDATIQKAAEDGLFHAISIAKEAGKPATAGALVCLDAQTGDVLAMASYPTFSPEAFTGGISSDDWNALSSESSGYPMLNRAISGMYPSASTIKPLASLAGLELGVVDENSTFDCVGFWTGFGANSGQWCWKHSGHGWLGLADGIINSCNTVFYEIGKRVFYSDDPEALQEQYGTWGLGKTSGIDLPGEAAGRLPTPEWKKQYYANYPGADTTWYGGDTTNIAIGQGDILVTPLQMACIYAGIATDGTIFTPHLLKSVSTKDGSGTVSEYKDNVAHKIEPNPEHLAYVKSALSRVAYEEDDAVAAHFANLPVKVASKTGTAEQAGKEPSGWYCCYAPAENPTYVISCIIEQGGFGATCAMYAARDTLGVIYNTPDTSSAYSTTQAM